MFAREPFAVQPHGAVRPVGSDVARVGRRDGPSVLLNAVDRDRHFLARFVDIDEDISGSSPCPHNRETCRQEKRNALILSHRINTHRLDHPPMAHVNEETYHIPTS